jgi:hypothetical protein
MLKVFPTEISTTSLVYGYELVNHVSSGNFGLMARRTKNQSGMLFWQLFAIFLILRSSITGAMTPIS